jgi:hypothetical protein
LTGHALGLHSCGLLAVQTIGASLAGTLAGRLSPGATMPCLGHRVRGQGAWHTMMSLDGFIAAPDDDMDSGTRISRRPGSAEAPVLAAPCVVSRRST